MFKLGLCQATIAAERASFGSVLSIRPRRATALLRRQLRWHINDVFTSGDELLSEQRTHPGRSLDRPRPRLEPRRPSQQPFALMTVGEDTQRVDHRFGVVDRAGGVGPLVRVDADHEHGVLQCCWMLVSPRWAHLICGCCRSSYEPHRDWIRTGWSLRSEVNHDSDRAFERHTRPDPERYESRNALAQDHLSGQSAPVRRSERPAERYTSAWWVASISLPLVFGCMLLGVGFGIGTLCTDTPGNGTLNESPCNRVNIGVGLNLGLQALLWLTAMILTARSGRPNLLTRPIVVLSIAIFAGSLMRPGCGGGFVFPKG